MFKAPESVGQPDHSYVAIGDTAACDEHSDCDAPFLLWRLYVSHFLSTWNSRVFEFGAVLFIASIFPGTLMPTSVYALFRSISAITFSPVIGNYVDRENRLHVVRLSIVLQRFAVAASCVLFWLMVSGIVDAQWQKFLLLGVLIVLACVEKLCITMNTISVERDWVVVISQHSTTDMQGTDKTWQCLITVLADSLANQKAGPVIVLNSQMRRIDLFCKLAGPLAISLVVAASTVAAILSVFTLNGISVLIEYFAIARVYKMVPALERSRASSDCSASSGEKCMHTSDAPPTSRWSKWLSNTYLLYLHHPIFLSSFSLSLVYFNILTFSSQFVAYLLSVGFHAAQIGLFRAVSVAAELSATWLGPWLAKKIGVVKAGLCFIIWQMVCLSVAVAMLWQPQERIARLVFIIGVIASRIGLWGFDLSVQVQVQDNVDEFSRGAFSSAEASFQNFFELLSYITTIIFSRTEQFRYPALFSALAVHIAGILYSKYAWKRSP